MPDALPTAASPSHEPAIGLDFDSTMFWLLKAMPLVPGGERVCYEDTPTWDALVDLCGPSNEQLRAEGKPELSHEERIPIMLGIFEECMKLDIMQKVGLIPGAVEQVRALHASGVKVHVITDRPDVRMPCTEQFLRMSGVPFDSIQKVRSGDKPQWCIDNGVHVLVDDHPVTITKAAEAGLSVHALQYLFNTKEGAHAGAKMHDNWETMGPCIARAVEHRYDMQLAQPAAKPLTFAKLDQGFAL